MMSLNMISHDKPLHMSRIACIQKADGSHDFVIEVLSHYLPSGLASIMVEPPVYRFHARCRSAVHSFTAHDFSYHDNPSALVDFDRNSIWPNTDIWRAYGVARMPEPRVDMMGEAMPHFFYFAYAQMSRYCPIPGSSSIVIGGDNVK